MRYQIDKLRGDIKHSSQTTEYNKKIFFGFSKHSRNNQKT